MLVKNIEHYPKFVFICENCGDCYATSDIEFLKSVKSKSTKTSVYALEIGDQIFFEPDSNKVYQIKNIKITHIVDNLEILNFGFDSEDCTNAQGEDKQWLLKIKVEMDLLK